MGSEAFTSSEFESALISVAALSPLLRPQVVILVAEGQGECVFAHVLHGIQLDAIVTLIACV